MLFTPEDQQAGIPEAELTTARMRGSAPNIRWHQRKDGSRLFIEGSVVALWNKTGELRGFQKIGQDVTQRHLAEKAVRESESRLRAILDSMHDGFALFDRDFTILDVNREKLRLDGRSREDLVGRSQWDAYPETAISPLGGLFRRLMRDRGPGSIDHRHVWPDGRDMWIEGRIYPTEDAGTAVFWRDMTDRNHAVEALRRSKEKYRSCGIFWVEEAQVV